MVLAIERLVKVYPGGRRALDEVSLDVSAGEFVVVIGLSGSGKSTLLRCVNGLVQPTSGHVTFQGVDLTAAGPRELRQARRQIGMVFQGFNLVKRASVLRNVLCGRLGYHNGAGVLLGRFPPEDLDRAAACLERVGLADLARQRADRLSGGQQQRVGIARALMQEPRLILADEPVASLDPATSDSVMRHLAALNREDGITVMCSLHFLSLARRYGTRVVALKDGRLVHDGPPESIDDQRFKAIYGADALRVEIV